MGSGLRCSNRREHLRGGRLLQSLLKARLRAGKERYVYSTSVTSAFLFRQHLVLIPGQVVLQKRRHRVRGAPAKQDDVGTTLRSDEQNGVNGGARVYMQAEEVTPVGSSDSTRDDDDDGHEAATAVPTSASMYAVAPEFGAKTPKEVYSEMEIDWLLEQVPALGEGAVRKRRVVFFDHRGKQVPLNRPAIRGLKRTNTCLTGGIVDFVLSRLFLQQPEGTQREVNMLSSVAVAAVREGFDGSEDGLQRFVDSHLRAPSPSTTHEVKELLVPWMHAGHWSLLVFQPDRVFHLDSASGEFHFPTTTHSGFCHSVNQAWQHARGVLEYTVDRVYSVQVLQQTSPAESGQHVLRNVDLYLKVCPLPGGIPGTELVLSSLATLHFVIN